MTNNNTPFGILGYGFVGKATHTGLLKNRHAIIHDILLGTSKEDLKNSKYIFVCIPTSNDSDIERMIEEIVFLKNQNPSCQIIIRSTVPVGICKIIQTVIQDGILYIPEFLRERFWDTDCHRRPLIVGNDFAKIPEWLATDEIIECSTAEAEVLKMFNNNYASLRVVFANHLYELSKATGSDYSKILNMYNSVKDEQTYLDVNDTLRGFGGKCLPKDLDFLISSFQKLNLDQKLFNALKSDNRLWPTTIKKS